MFRGKGEIENSHSWIEDLGLVQGLGFRFRVYDFGLGLRVKVSTYSQIELYRHADLYSRAHD